MSRSHLINPQIKVLNHTTTAIQFIQELTMKI